MPNMDCHTKREKAALDTLKKYFNNKGIKKEEVKILCSQEYSNHVEISVIVPCNGLFIVKDDGSVLDDYGVFDT